MPQDFGIEKIVVAVHIPGNNLQQVISITRHGVALHDLWQESYMPFEVLTIFVSVFGHCHQQQDLDVEANNLGVQ